MALNHYALLRLNGMSLRRRRELVARAYDIRFKKYFINLPIGDWVVRNRGYVGIKISENECCFAGYMSTDENGNFKFKSEYAQKIDIRGDYEN